MNKNRKTIMVSGCTRGIGRGVCEWFAQKGFNVAGFARTKPDIERMRERMEKSFPQQHFFFVNADASKKEQVKKFGADVLEKFSKVDILVNNAGTFVPGTLLHEPETNLEKLIETNLYSAYFLSRVIVPAMIKNKSGHVFNICSIASLNAYENGGSYTISKFALRGFSKQLRMETMDKSIRITGILPGATLTDSWHDTDVKDSRFIMPEDIAKTIWNCYELSDSANVDEIVIRPKLGDI
ncbi:MAG: SDR family oxidoreductase [Bacteroidia bacterium]